MDLATLDTSAAAAESAVMQVRHPATNDPLVDDDKNPITITLLGVDSQVFREGERRITNERLRGGRRAKASAERIETESIKLLADCTVAWSGIQLDGEVLPFSRDNVVMLYRRLIWLREQVDDFIGERANFLKASV